jgi:trans-AT polyketide synthase, acyltransferase and oxidoreductase domains
MDALSMQTKSSCLEELLNSNQPLYLVNDRERVRICNASEFPDSGELPLFVSPALSSENLGSSAFKTEYNVKYACMSGAMAGGIAGENLVVAMCKGGFLSVFGAGGLPLKRLEDAIVNIHARVGNGSFAVNLINNPSDPELEFKTVELLLHHKIDIIEASAYMRVTPALVYYRAKGLREMPDGTVHAANRIIAKLSSPLVAKQFLAPASPKIVKMLVDNERITSAEALLLERIPLADDITVEADSGGHTDNRPLINILKEIMILRDRIQHESEYVKKIRIGAAGGISTPYAAAAVFAMGADYVVTGSVNHACVEASTSSKVKELLSKAAVSDVAMVPSADMFELGVQVQVLKKNVLYPMRAKFLYELYKKYSSLDDVKVDEKKKLETELFRRPMDDIWNETKKFFETTNPSLISKADADPKVKMALVFRWYLGLSARWACKGEDGREDDYQIWCGPSMGAFNEWVKGTPLEKPENRFVAVVNELLMNETAVQLRIMSIRAAGFTIPM